MTSGKSEAEALAALVHSISANVRHRAAAALHD
jgi:hypothetical protein